MQLRRRRSITVSSQVFRGAFGPYGTAVKEADKGLYLAWAAEGETEAENPILEDGETWFNFGDTPEEALARLRKELKGLLS
jgi:hypothetical protein